ncbi:MAG: glycerophosphodiester phosphodiesterase [Flavobacterium sp.]|nr:glycerophosphodiester phosphodiesterase [Flavobacterium sp.]
MQTIGHRGAKGYSPENTLHSFQKALNLGCHGIELDVHLSADNIPIVIHDNSIDRTTTGSGLVRNFTAHQLQLYGIPSLQDVLELVNKQCFINIEIKDSTATPFVLELLDQLKVEAHWYQISSFHWEVLSYCKSQNKNIAVAVLTDSSINDALAFAKTIKAQSINAYYKLINQEMVTLMHQNKLLVYAWTVNEPEDISKMKRFNVDGIISDYPDRI